MAIFLGEGEGGELQLRENKIKFERNRWFEYYHLLPGPIMDTLLIENNKFRRCSYNCYTDVSAMLLEVKWRAFWPPTYRSRANGCGWLWLWNASLSSLLLNQFLAQTTPYSSLLPTTLSHTQHLNYHYTPPPLLEHHLVFFFAQKMEPFDFSTSPVFRARFRPV